MNGQQFYWTGTYSFKPEIKMFLEAIRHQIDKIIAKIDALDAATERD